MSSRSRRASARDPASATTSNSGSLSNMKPRGSRKAAWSSTSRTRFTLHDLQLETENRAVPWPRVERQVAAVGLYYATAQVEAETDPVRLPAGSASPKLLEDALNVVGVHTVSPIGHLYADAPGGVGGDRPQLDRGAVGRVL